MRIVFILILFLFSGVFAQIQTDYCSLESCVSSKIIELRTDCESDHGRYGSTIQKESVSYDQETDTFTYRWVIRSTCEICQSPQIVQKMAEDKALCEETECRGYSGLCVETGYKSAQITGNGYPECIAVGQPITTGHCEVESSSSSVESSSSNEFHLCHATKEIAQNALDKLISECNENEGAHDFVIEENTERGFCIQGACHYDVSSSSEIVESSSSAEITSSSSSVGAGNDESCEIPANYWVDMAPYGVFQRTLYKQYPSMLNKNDIYVSNCNCRSNNMIACELRNFNFVHDYVPSSMPLCGFSNGYWCRGINNSGICNFSGSVATIYHANNQWYVVGMADNQLYPLDSHPSLFGMVRNAGSPQEWFERYFTHGYILPEGVSTSDIEAIILSSLPEFPSLDKMHAYCLGEWIPHAEECYGTQEEALKEARDLTLACNGSGSGEFSVNFSTSKGWCVEGECIQQSSSSTEIGNSSSVFEEFSSSSFMLSSSSETTDNGNCILPPGQGIPPNGVETCIIVNNQCYKCNPARGSECNSTWLWDGYNVNNPWWFVEAPCSVHGGLLKHLVQVATTNLPAAQSLKAQVR